MKTRPFRVPTIDCISFEAIVNPVSYNLTSKWGRDDGEAAVPAGTAATPIKIRSFAVDKTSR